MSLIKTAEGVAIRRVRLEWALKVSSIILIIKEYDWPEVRSIAIACGLQNTQFAMSSIFGAFHQQEFVTRMHAYSPMYGVFSMVYAFIISATWRRSWSKNWKWLYLSFHWFYFSTSKPSYELYRLKKYKEQPPVGPRIPNVNIEGNHRFKDDTNFCCNYSCQKFQTLNALKKFEKSKRPTTRFLAF